MDGDWTRQDINDGFYGVIDFSKLKFANTIAVIFSSSLDHPILWSQNPPWPYGLSFRVLGAFGSRAGTP